MCFLMGSIFYSGYNLGALECARNPDFFQKRHHYSSPPKENDNGTKKTTDLFELYAWWKQSRRVSRVGERIVKVAQQQVERDCVEAQTRVSERVQANNSGKVPSKDELQEALSQDQDFMRCYEAKLEMDGTWQFHLVPHDATNALTTAVMPRQVFITTSLVSLLEDDDQLAMVLGHELAHKMNHDFADRFQLESMLKTLEVTLLGSMDPSKRLLSMLVLPFVGRLVYSGEMRQQERDADYLGIELATRAGFDAQRGAHALSKLVEREEEDTEKNVLSAFYPSFLRSHPLTNRRYQDILKHCNKQEEESLNDNSEWKREKKTVSSSQAFANRFHKWVKGLVGGGGVIQ